MGRKGSGLLSSFTGQYEQHLVSMYSDDVALLSACGRTRAMRYSELRGGFLI